MTKTIQKERVKGGWVSRETRSGRFVSVVTDKSKSFRSSKTGQVIKEASSKRSGALKRLADR